MGEDMYTAKNLCVTSNAEGQNNCFLSTLCLAREIFNFLVSIFQIFASESFFCVARPNSRSLINLKLSHVAVVKSMP